MTPAHQKLMDDTREWVKKQPWYKKILNKIKKWSAENTITE